MKKNLKKLFSLLAIFALAVLLVATVSCSGDKKEEKKTEAKTEDVGTVTESENETTAEEITTAKPVKERDVPYQDKVEDDVVNDEF